MMLSGKWLAIAALLTLTACAGGKAGLNLTPVSYGAIPGWHEDAQAEAFGPFVESCRVNARRARYFESVKGEAFASRGDWQAACDAAAHLQNPTNEEARAFFETHFTPYRATEGNAAKGLTTGYYEPMLHGSLKPTARYNVPVYGVPYRFSKPSYTRAQIASGALRGKAPVLLYVDDKVMLFFLHIQGSGKVRLEDGRPISLQYAQQNGRSYVPIGRVLKERGELQTVTMQTIRDWLHANPSRADEVMNTNPSYIFFRRLDDGAYAKGALGLSLTPERSIAVDDERVPYGTPIFLATRVKDGTHLFDQRFRKLTVAQDTGGAIIGPIRYDIFFGRGEEAEWKAGHQNTRASVYWLLPNTPGVLAGLGL